MPVKYGWNTLLGYIISPIGIYMESNYIKSIKNWPESKFIKKIQVVIWFANFYWQFNQNFSTITDFFISMLKIALGYRFLKLAKMDINLLS